LLRVVGVVEGVTQEVRPLENLFRPRWSGVVYGVIVVEWYLLSVHTHNPTGESLPAEGDSDRSRNKEKNTYFLPMQLGSISPARET
jgi:hypothetical protein